MIAAGSPDPAANVIRALLAQGVAPFDAARVGVYLHGLAGDAVRERLGDAGLLASDLPDQIAAARRRLVDLASRGRMTKRLGFGARDSSPPGGTEG